MSRLKTTLLMIPILVLVYGVPIWFACLFQSPSVPVELVCLLALGVREAVGTVVMSVIKGSRA